VSEEARKTRWRGDTRCLFTLNLMERGRGREIERIRIDNIFLNLSYASLTVW
jgi:hypothetical protein